MRPDGSIEIVGVCASDSGQPETHHVWLTPQGDIHTPDHPKRWSQDEVAVALGGPPTAFCDVWRAAATHQTSATKHPAEKPPHAPYLNPDVNTWRYNTGGAAWCTRTQWFTNSTLLGRAERRPLPPEYVLEVTQLFHRTVSAPPPSGDTWPNMVHTFYTPTSRDVWRRTGPTPPSEIVALLESGLDVALCADAAALNITPGVAAAAAHIFTSSRIPHSWLIGVANILTPERLAATIAHWETLPPQQVHADIVGLYGRHKK